VNNPGFGVASNPIKVTIDGADGNTYVLDTVSMRFEAADEPGKLSVTITGRIDHPVYRCKWCEQTRVSGPDVECEACQHLARTR
jgi:hypothetical protein